MSRLKSLRQYVESELNKMEDPNKRNRQDLTVFAKN